ncbi:MAG: cyclic nucleotide-binding domain-containing protein [Pseudomonadota bacterium]
MGNGLIELAGWAAGAFTLMAYSAKTMKPLRIAAIVSNILFIVYGALVPIYPTLVLHAILLPFNAYRLFELFRNDRRAKATLGSDEPLHWIASLVAPVDYAPGEVIFAQGDSPDHVYYLEDGVVELEEPSITLSKGDLFGEIAFFTDAQERTFTARARTACRIMVLDERDFMRLYYQQPAFALYVVKLIATRLSANQKA